MPTNVFLSDRRLTFPFKGAAAPVSFSKGAVPKPPLVTPLPAAVAVATPPPAAPAAAPAKPSAAYRAGVAVRKYRDSAPQRMADTVVNTVKNTKNDVKAIGNAVTAPARGSFTPEQLAARTQAGIASGMHADAAPLLANASGRNWGRYGAMAGAAMGALNPGKDEDGDERSSIGGALRGAVRGGIVSGAAGALTRRAYVDPKIVPHLNAAPAAPVVTKKRTNSGAKANPNKTSRTFEIGQSGGGNKTPRLFDGLPENVLPQSADLNQLDGTSRIVPRTVTASFLGIPLTFKKANWRPGEPGGAWGAFAQTPAAEEWRKKGTSVNFC